MDTPAFSQFHCLLTPGNDSQIQWRTSLSQINYNKISFGGYFVASSIEVSDSFVCDPLKGIVTAHRRDARCK